MTEWNDEKRRRLRAMRIDELTVEEFVARARQRATEHALKDTGSRIYGRRHRTQEDLYVQPLTQFRQSVSSNLKASGRLLRRLGRLLRTWVIIVAMIGGGFIAVRIVGFKNVAIALGVLLAITLIAIVILLVIAWRRQEK
jgi:hypothetical protein